MTTQYEDFYLHVGWPDETGRYPVQVISSPCGETLHPVWQLNTLNLPASRNILDYLEDLIVEPEELQHLGITLHDFLFPPEVADIYSRCREGKDKWVRIRLRLDPEELSLLPWEYAYDRKTRQFLALERQTPIVRYIAEGFGPATNLSMPNPVKLLVVLASPSDQPELNQESEEKGIRQALKNIPAELCVLRHVTIEKLHNALVEFKPHILHFSGHGVMQDGAGALALENPANGETDPLTARKLRGLVNNLQIVLAVLNACETAKHSTRDALMGVAQALIREQVPAVIAMQFVISETIALLFTRRLYEFLFRGESIEKIVTETRVGIDINSQEDCISWGIPVLFLRSKDGYLWQAQRHQKGSGLDSLEIEDLREHDIFAFPAVPTTENILLKKVYRQWVMDVLSSSIPNAERKIELVIQQRDNGTHSTDNHLTAIFDGMDGSFLLLGAPGSGKTIALCELVKDLIDRAARNDRYPLPVILRLATWRTSPHGSLTRWVDEQIRAQYGLGQNHLNEIAPRGMILLLDGLDEVRSEDRESCVHAINEFCKSNGWVNLVVTCREYDYDELLALKSGLTIPKNQVITISALETQRIENFLLRLDRVGVDVSYLFDLLQSESTPLMTNVILQTYEGRNEKEYGNVNVTEIWRNYVKRKFDDEEFRCERAGTQIEHEVRQTHAWLKWLAIQLQSFTKDRHRLFLEEMQPQWLSRSGLAWFYLTTFFTIFLPTLAISIFAFRSAVPIFYGNIQGENFMSDFLLIAAPLGACWITAFIWIISRRAKSYRGPVILGLLSGITFGTMVWIPYRDMPILAVTGGLIAVMVVTILARMVIKILGFSQQDITCVKSRRWDWRKAIGGMAIGIVFITTIGLVSDIARSIVMDRLGLWSAFSKSFSLNSVVWWNWGLPGLLSMSLFFFFLLGRGWGVLALREEVDKPNQGIIDSGKTGLIVGLIGLLAGIIFSLAIGIPCYLGLGWNISSGICIAGNPSSLFSGLGFGIAYGLILGLTFGQIFGGFAWIRHYILRWLLHFSAIHLPWRLTRFLRFAAKLNLLRRVGGGYEFIDQELQHYFEIS